MDNKEMWAHVSISTVPQTLEQAEILLQLAEERSEDHTPLWQRAARALGTNEDLPTCLG